MEAHATVMSVVFVIGDIRELCLHLLERSSDDDADTYFRYGMTMPLWHVNVK